MTHLDVPANARFFQFSAFYRPLTIGCLITFCIFIIGGIFLPLFDPGRRSLVISAICVVEFGFFALLAAHAVRISRDRIAVSEDGLWSVPRRGPSTFIRWDEVANVEAREVRKRLVVTDTTGLKRINLEYQLDRFEQLRDFVLERTAARRRQTFAPTVFRGSYLNWGILFFGLLMWLAFAVMSIRGGRPGAATVLFGFALLTLYRLAREPRRLAISNLSITIGYLGWRRAIPFDSVTNIEIDNIRGNENAVAAAVFVETASGRPLKLIGFSGGSVALYDALCAGWAAARGANYTPNAPAAKSLAFAAEPAAMSAVTIPVLPRVFHAGLQTWLVVVGPVFAYSAAVLGEQLYRGRLYPGDRNVMIMGWCALLAVYLFLALLRVPRRVTVSSKALEVQYTLWRRAVPYGAIADIELNNGRDLRNKRTHVVRVQLQSGRTLRLASVREGTPELYQVLRAAWETGFNLASARSASSGASPTSVSAHAPYSGDPMQTAQFARLLPAWFLPAVAATVALFVLVALPGNWRRVLRLSRPAPDTKALARFAQLRTGWKGTPQPLFPGDLRYHRWNVDYATGVFSHCQPDFYIGDSIPINLTRIYLNRYESEAFGVGMSASYDMFLTGDADRFTYLDLIMPNGQQFHFKRISPGASWAGSVFRCDPAGNDPPKSTFPGARLWWNGNGWSLRLTDGTLMKFPAVRGTIRPGQGALLSIENGYGDVLTIKRDRNGNILEITSPHGASVILTHDKKDRITSGTDSFANTVTYSYDDFDRLVAVRDSREGITRYSYNAGNNLVKVTKPDGAAWIQVAYDPQGRVVNMFFEGGSSCRYAYKTDPQGAIAAVDVLSSDGPPRHVTIGGTAAQDGFLTK